MEEKLKYKNGCYIGEIKFLYEEDGIEYYIRQGKGTMFYNNGMTMKGYWNNDKLEGYGKIKYADGDEYKGNFKNGYKHGSGTFKFANTGNVYKVVMNCDKLVMKCFDHKEIVTKLKDELVK